MGLTKLAAVLIVVTLTVIGLLQIAVGRTSQVSVAGKGRREEALQIVRMYVGLSVAGKFEDLTAITTTVPKFANKNTKATERRAEQEKKAIPSGTHIAMSSREDSLAVRLDWIRKEFSKSILDDNKRIVVVGDVIVKDNLAKVSVNLGNDQRYTLLPWVFMLVKQERDGQWKIYDINTPAYADDYYPIGSQGLGKYSL